MQNKLEKDFLVLTSMCDDTARLSVPAVFSVFMDLATEHAQTLGCGGDALSERGLFWLVVRTKINIVNRPPLMRALRAATWPEEAGRARCTRYYSLSDGKFLVEGKTEWAVADIESGRPQRVDSVYPEGMAFCEDKVCEEPFSRVSADFSDAEQFATYTVRSTDIDLAHHMNNAAYIRALFGAFSCKELEEMNIRSVEIAYRIPCFEGDELAFLKRPTENGLEIGILRADGTTAATVILK